MASGDEGVLSERRGAVGWVRLCRPRLTADMAAELAALAEALEEDEAVVAVALVGTGDAFCTGFEVPEGLPRRQAVGSLFERLDPRGCVSAVAALTKPTVAVLNGDAVGAGLELALACDLRVAAAQARIGLPQVSEGLIPFCGGTQRLPRLVGAAKALELILTGELIDGREAGRIGLVSHVAEKEALAGEAEKLLAELCTKGPVALRFGKEAVLKSLDLTLEQGIRLEEDLYVLLQTTQDRAEGVRAFLEKRPPRFAGK